MAFFKFRKSGDDSAAAARQPESIEAMRRRARHRLVGAAVLVLAGVIGFPWLFDTQPRPVAVDIPIEIPDRNKVKPLAQPKPRTEVQGVVAPAPAPAATAAAPAAVVAEGKADPLAESASQDKAVASPEPPAKAPTPAPPAPQQATPRAVSTPAEKAQPKQAAAAAAPAGEGRYVVQVGAFADAGKARDARQRVERAGLKTYTNVAESKDGKRTTRVRVGPFANRAEADRAAAKIKGLDLPAAILTL